MALIADELSFERFAVTGGSGGDPIPCVRRTAAGSCCAGGLHRGRCTARTPGLERDAWLDGQDPENVKEFEWAEAGEDVLADELERLQATILEQFAVDPSTVLGDFELSESDPAQLTRPEVMEVIRAATAEQAVNGVWGWVDDDLAILHPWGFDVDTIRVPVLVRYGMTDVLVPPAHGEWLAANVPGCVVKIDDVAGHLGSDPVQEIGEQARWLRDGEPPP